MKSIVTQLLVSIVLAVWLLGSRVVELYNSTIGRIVEVPEEAADLYLAQPAYRKVKAADRVAGVPDDAGNLTISQADYAAALSKAASDAVATAETDKQAAVDAAVAAALANAETEKQAAIADALAQHAAQNPPQ